MQRENNKVLLIERAATDKRHKVMTQQEFTQRTKVEVSVEEFEVINYFYMSCECDKDEFCKMWRKMNPNRVKSARVEKMAKAKNEAFRDTLRKFYDKTSNQDMWSTHYYFKMTVREVQALSYAGITVANDCGSGLKILSDIRYEIGKYLGRY